MTLTVQDNPLFLPTACLSDTALTLPDGVSFDAWVNIQARLYTVQEASNWWIGDWVVFGEAHYGEAFSQGIPDKDREHIQQCAWVAQRVSVDRRRPPHVLSWTHHRVVAGLEPEQQEQMLQQAVEQGWSVRELGDAVRIAQGKTPTVHTRVDKDGLERLSREKVGLIWTESDHWAVLAALGKEGEQ